MKLVLTFAALLSLGAANVAVAATAQKSSDEIRLVAVVYRESLATRLLAARTDAALGFK